MILAPEKDPNAAQTETFSLDDLLSYYAEFEFQGGNTEAVNGMNDLEFEVDHLHSFTETLLNKASFYACNFVAAEGEVTVKEGPEDTLMDLDISEDLSVNKQNRSGCLCLSCKTELLAEKHRCPHQCVYCYWQD